MVAAATAEQLLSRYLTRTRPPPSGLCRVLRVSRGLLGTELLGNGLLGPSEA